MNTAKWNNILTAMLCYGLCLFIVSYFVYPLDSSPKAFFYLFVALPALLYGLNNLARLKLRPIKRFDMHSYLIAGPVIIILYIWFSYLWGSPTDYQPFVSKSKRAAEMLVLLFAIYIMVNQRASLIKPLFTAMFVVAVIHACILILEHLPTYQNKVLFRITNPIDTGMVYGVAVVIGMWRFFSEELKVSLLYLLGCLPLLVILVMTKSRGPQLALIITALPIVFMYRSNWRRTLSVALIAAVSAAILALWTDVFQNIFSRGFDYSLRDQIWVVSIKQFLEFPVFGSGARLDMPVPINNGVAFSHSHNLLLDVLRATGLVGFLLVAVHNSYAFWKGVMCKNMEVVLWVMIFLFGFLCLSSNGGIPFSRPSHSWIAYWIPLGFICYMLPASNKLSNK